MTEVLKALGPWALVLVSMGAMLKFLVVNKLSSIEETLGRLTESQDDHKTRITKIETVMEMNGCFPGGQPRCKA